MNSLALRRHTINHSKFGPELQSLEVPKKEQMDTFHSLMPKIDQNFKFVRVTSHLEK